MFGSAKDVSVDVILESDNPVKFHLQSTDLPIVNGDLIFDNDHHNGFKIQFNLQDQTGKNYLFPPNSKKHDAVFSALGAGACPVANGKPQVFQVVGVDEPACTTLRVQNPNVSPVLGAFSYALQVTKDGGANYLPLDPGGVNQNGPTTFSAALGVVFVFGAVVGSLVTIGAQNLLG